MNKDKVDEKEVKQKLTEEEYKVLRKKGTEKPFSGELLNEKRPGIFACKVCGNEIFKTENKFDSGTGWPSFDRPISPDKVILIPEDDGTDRTEVTCSKCGSHLGHVFSDGPKETTGDRYCINSICLGFDMNK